MLFLLLIKILNCIPAWQRPSKDHLKWKWSRSYSLCSISISKIFIHTSFNKITSSSGSSTSINAWFHFILLISFVLVCFDLITFDLIDLLLGYRCIWSRRRYLWYLYSGDPEGCVRGEIHERKHIPRRRGFRQPSADLPHRRVQEGTGDWSNQGDKQAQRVR